MAYKGYQAKINGVTIPCINLDNKTNIVVSGSYSVTDQVIVNGEWVDINGNTHRDVHPRKKKSISFQIKERTQKEQEMIAPIMAVRENIRIEYWDDIYSTYVESTFYLDDFESISSIATSETIYYDAIQLTYMEY